MAFTLTEKEMLRVLDWYATIVGEGLHEEEDIEVAELMASHARIGMVELDRRIEKALTDGRSDL